MAQLDFVGIEKAWVANGGNPAWAPLMAGIALAESGGNTDATNSSDPYGGSFGLWQINGSHAPGGVASPAWVAKIKTPTQNAKEAVSLFATGAGVNAWRTDHIWLQWVHHGSPSKPSATTVHQWLIAAGLGGMGTAATDQRGASTGKNPGASATTLGTNESGTGKTTKGKTTTCLVKFPGVAGVGSFCIFSKSEGRAVLGAGLVLVGAGTMALGVILLAAYGLGSTKAASSLASGGPIPGPQATAIRAVASTAGRAKARRKAKTQNVLDERSEATFEGTQTMRTRAERETAEHRRHRRDVARHSRPAAEPPFTTADRTHRPSRERRPRAGVTRTTRN